MDSAREAVAWLERHATYTRTGHHSARTGEWRDGDGLVASLFLHHLSRDGDPQLHVHVAIWNRVQRADGADAKWRTLDSRSLHNQRLAVAPVADRILETKLSALGYVDGAPGRRQRRRGRRRQPGRDGPVQLPRGRGHRRAGPARPRVRGGARQAAVAAHAVAAAPAGRAEHPPHQGRRPAAPSPGRPARPNPPRRSGSPPGKHRPRAAKCTPCRPCTSRSRAFAAERAGRAPAVLDDAAKRTAARIAVAEVQKQHAVWSMAQLRFEVHRALPVLPAGHRRPGGGRRGGQAGRLRPGRHRGRPGHRPGPRRRDQPRRPRLRRRQHLPAAERGTLLHPGPPRHRRADPRGRETNRAAARQPRAGPGRRRAHRADRRAARRRGHDAHRGRGHDRAGRPGRGGQEPHHGRVRPAVDHLHRPPRHRPDHLHQRRPGPGARGPGRELQHRRSSSARPKAPTSCAAPSRCTRTTCSSWTRPASSAPPTWP